MILIEVVNSYGTVLAYNHDKVLIAKTCGKCNELKNLSDFHKTTVSSTGTVSSCKACIKDFHNQNYRKNTKTYKSIYDDTNRLVSRECSKCNVIHPVDFFYKHKRGKDGFSSSCMECTSDHGKVYRSVVPEKIKERSQKYYANNFKKIKAINRTRRLAARKQKTFYKKFESEIAQVYTTAQEAAASGFKVSVDHIIPLIHPHVCGLHYPPNLEIISDSLNCSKGNKWDGTHENNNWERDWKKGKRLNKGSNNE